jgi:hypothetical protein
MHFYSASQTYFLPWILYGNLTDSSKEMQIIKIPNDEYIVCIISTELSIKV